MTQVIEGAAYSTVYKFGEYSEQELPPTQDGGADLNSSEKEDFNLSFGSGISVCQ